MREVLSGTLADTNHGEGVIRFRIHEGEFQLPDMLHDQTVNVFTVTPSGAGPFDILITRSVPQTGQLDDHVRSELAVMKQAIVGFEVL